MVNLDQLNIDERKIYFNKKNKKHNKHDINCIYGLTNEQYKNYIKIGSTNNPERRKYDYITSSPYKYEYLWIFYLENFNYLLCDELIKFELKNLNVRYSSENVGIEFYNIKTPEIISNILDKYDIKFRLEIGDKFNKKIHINKHYVEYTNMDNDFLKILSKYTPEEIKQLALVAGIADKNEDPELDISNYKYHYVKQYLDLLTSCDLSNINCQSKDFFLERLNKNIKNMCILGHIQSGKTNEIINLVFLCIIFLKIPVIIVIQNKTSGYKQLVSRFNEFVKTLKKYNFKIRYTHGSGLTQNNSKRIFNPNNPQPEVIIALSNYKQLEKIEQHITIVQHSNNGKVAPYALFMDEYDELIKSRSDIDTIENLSFKQKNDLEKGIKKIEKHTKFIRNNSLFNCGITATLLSVMLTDNNLKLGDIFSLSPSSNYVGFGSSKINIIDIKPYITKIKNKLSIHINNLEYLIDEIDKSLDIDDNKDYSILLINVSDLSSVHNNIYEIFKNHFTEWSCIILNSKGDDGDIRCSLPTQIFSDITYKTGTFTLYKDKTYTIVKNTEIIPENHLLAVDRTKEERTYFKYSVIFSNCSVSDIITKLMEYTSKVAIVSGKMACRGLSFVDNAYKKHITDMIYVPSSSSSYTRNLQDMRIFGNYYEDGIDINLYTNETIYKEDIKTYLLHQTNILHSGDVDKSCKANFSNYKFNPKDIPIKRLDRPGLTKGIQYNPNSKWGIETRINDIDLAYSKLKTKYKNYDIIKYSIHKKIQLPNNISFVQPIDENINYRKIYKKLFLNELKSDINNCLSYFDSEIDNENSNQHYVRNNYKNGWPLHNPLNINYKNKKGEKINRKIPNICYMGNNNDNYINIIVRNINYDYETLINMKGTCKIILFYSKDCYNYIKCDEEYYMINDI